MTFRFATVAGNSPPLAHAAVARTRPSNRHPRLVKQKTEEFSHE